MNAVIIDDEQRAISILEMIVKEYCKQINIVGTALSVSNGIKIIKELNPDLVFLDIEMPEGNGFDVLQAFEKRSFEVIFVTAYNHYALRAIKYAAADYILKPVDIDEVKLAVENIFERKTRDDKPKPNIDSLLLNIKFGSIPKIAIPSIESTEFIPIDDILYLIADRSYCNIFLSNKRNIVASKSLSELEQLLPKEVFCRIHKSFLVNINYVNRYYKTDGGYVEMSDGKKFSISRAKKESFIEQLNKWSINY